VTILSGKVKELINQIIHGRSNGNPAITEMTKSKFILKGINPDKFDSDSYDDPVIIRKLHNIAKELKIEKYIDKETDIISAYSTRSSEEEIVSEIKN
jgi:hypothetical protein